MGITNRSFKYDDDLLTEKENKYKSNGITFTYPKLLFESNEVKKFLETHEFFNVDEIFKEMTSVDAYIQYQSLIDYLFYKFIKINKCAPDIFRITEDTLKYEKFIDTFFNKFKVPETAYIKSIIRSFDGLEINSLFLSLDKDCWIYFFDSEVIILFNRKYSKIEIENNPLKIFLGVCEKFKAPSHEKNKIFVVYRDKNGSFSKQGFDIKKIKINLAENYNDGFEEVFHNIVKKLNDKKNNGLVILQGLPGTGKTYAIRHLTSKLKKNIIFIPPDMVDYITDPSFIPFLIQNDHSILIIEDAEPALQKRGNGGRTSSVSNLLNLADGLLSDCVNISILCTFNTDTKNLDEALFRKGRLMECYKFDKLSKDKATNLLHKLGHNIEAKGPMTLSDIYNYDENNGSEKFIKESTIGFKK